MPALAEDFLGKLEAGAVTGIGKVIDAVNPRFDKLGNGLGQVGGIGGVAYLVGDDAQGFTGVGRGNDLGREIIAAG